MRQSPGRNASSSRPAAAATNSWKCVRTIRIGLEWRRGAVALDFDFLAMGSDLAVGDKMRGGAQNIAARTKRFQRAVGVIHKRCESRARAIAAQN